MYILHMYLLDLFIIYSYHMRRRFMYTPSATCTTLVPGTHNSIRVACVHTHLKSTPQIRWRFFRNIILILIIGECAQKSL